MVRSKELTEIRGGTFLLRAVDMISTIKDTETPVAISIMDTVSSCNTFKKSTNKFICITSCVPTQLRSISW